jgi:hypothetical protein
MVDPTFGKMNWDDSGYWRATTPLSYFKGCGADIPHEPGEDRDDPSEPGSLLKAGKVSLHIATEGGNRKKPTPSQQETWSALLGRGDAVWDEVLDRLLADYELQWPCRQRWWQATYGDAPSGKIIPKAPTRDRLRKLLLPVWVTIMPPATPKAPAVDVGINFAATWSPNGVAALIRDGHVVDLAAYLTGDLQPLAKLQHPVFGPLRRIQSEDLPWYGTTCCEPFRDFCAIANDRAAFKHDPEKFGAASKLLADFARGQFTLEVHTAPGKEPNEKQAAAFTMLRNSEAQFAAAAINAVFKHYQSILNDARAAYEKRLEITERLSLRGVELDYLAPVDDVLPTLNSPDGLRELIQLEYIHVHPEHGKNQPVAIGLEFSGVANLSFGVLWRNGQIEAAGEYKIAKPAVT